MIRLLLLFLTLSALALVVFSVFMLQGTSYRASQSSDENNGRIPNAHHVSEHIKVSDIHGLSLIERISIHRARLHTRFFPIQSAVELANVDMVTIADTDKESLRMWIARIGANGVMQKILHDLGNNESAPACHIAGHFVGQESYALVREHFLNTCTNLCYSGCVHGGLEAMAREYGIEQFTDQVNIMCAQSDNPSSAHGCFHGAGHGAMALLGGQLYDALELCDDFPDSPSRTSCHAGVFMENIMSDGGGAHSSLYLSDDMHYPCLAVAERYRDACYFFQTLRVVRAEGVNFNALALFCASAPVPGREGCYLGMGREAIMWSTNESAAALAVCQSVEDTGNQHLCVQGIVQNLFWSATGAEEAVSFCRGLVGSNEKNICYAELASRSKFIVDVTDQAKICATFEDGYRHHCTNCIDTALLGTFFTTKWYPNAEEYFCSVTET